MHFLTLQCNFATYTNPSLCSRIVHVCDKGEFLSMRGMFRRIICTCELSHEITCFERKQSTVILLITESQGILTSSISDLKKRKAVPLYAWSDPEGSRKLRFPDYMTTARNGVKVVSLTHRPPLPPGNAPGTHFC